MLGNNNKIRNRILLTYKRGMWWRIGRAGGSWVRIPL